MHDVYVRATALFDAGCSVTTCFKIDIVVSSQLPLQYVLFTLSVVCTPVTSSSAFAVAET